MPKEQLKNIRQTGETIATPKVVDQSRAFDLVSRTVKQARDRLTRQNEELRALNDLEKQRYLENEERELDEQERIQANRTIASSQRDLVNLESNIDSHIKENNLTGTEATRYRESQVEEWRDVNLKRGGKNKYFEQMFPKVDLLSTKYLAKSRSTDTVAEGQKELNEQMELSRDLSVKALDVNTSVDDFYSIVFNMQTNHQSFVDESEGYKGFSPDQTRRIAAGFRADIDNTIYNKLLNLSNQGELKQKDIRDIIDDSHQKKPKTKFGAVVKLARSPELLKRLESLHEDLKPREKEQRSRFVDMELNSLKSLSQKSPVSKADTEKYNSLIDEKYSKDPQAARALKSDFKIRSMQGVARKAIKENDFNTYKQVNESLMNYIERDDITSTERLAAQETLQANISAMSEREKMANKEGPASVLSPEQIKQAKAEKDPVMRKEMLRKFITQNGDESNPGSRMLPEDQKFFRDLLSNPRLSVDEIYQTYLAERSRSDIDAMSDFATIYKNWGDEHKEKALQILSHIFTPKDLRERVATANLLSESRGKDKSFPLKASGHNGYDMVMRNKKIRDGMTPNELMTGLHPDVQRQFKESAANMTYLQHQSSPFKTESSARSAFISNITELLKERRIIEDGQGNKMMIDQGAMLRSGFSPEKIESTIKTIQRITEDQDGLAAIVKQNKLYRKVSPSVIADAIQDPEEEGGLHFRFVPHLNSLQLMRRVGSGYQEVKGASYNVDEIKNVLNIKDKDPEDVGSQEVQEVSSLNDIETDEVLNFVIENTVKPERYAYLSDSEKKKIKQDMEETLKGLAPSSFVIARDSKNKIVHVDARVSFDDETYQFDLQRKLQQNAFISNWYDV